jgi:hypothetical protein
MLINRKKGNKIAKHRIHKIKRAAVQTITPM